MFIHRWEPNFVIQGGGRYVADFTALPPANFPEIVSFPPIANEFNVGIHYSNVFGTIALAKTSDPNSATSEWFFNLADNSVPGGLDEVTNSGGFTVFGHVVSGTNVLNRFNYTTGAGGVFYTGYGDLVSIPVLLSSVSQQPTLYNLVFVDITLLNVQIANKNGLSQISWNSVSNQANVVEYTTTFPPAWQTVTSLVGNGSATSVVDPTSANANRFYRVRVVY
jgi:cyclophilin family peptidyl-prolyl cis-trans isomerase